MRTRIAQPIARLAGALALVGAAACGGEPEPPRFPNLVIVSLDTIRADHTSLHGYERATTPELDRIASEGIYFDLAYTMTSTTGPTHATLFTGKYAPAHGVRRNGLMLVDRETTLAEHLRSRGYRTGAVVSSFVLDAKFGYGQGFDHYEDDFEAETSSMAARFWEGHAVPEGAFDRPGDVTTDLAEQFLRDVPKGRPFFLFVHYFDAHEPYHPVEGFTERFAQGEPGEIDLYDGEIAFVDAELGRLDRLLERLGVRDDTVLIVTTDHGQGLMDHGDPYHGVDVYEESVRTVFVVRWPRRIPGGGQPIGPVSHVDVLPTVLDLVTPGSHGALRLPGRSLAGALLEGAPLPAEHPVYLYRQIYPRPVHLRGNDVVGEQFGVRAGRWKYVRGDRDGSEKLFDLESDPQEMRNRAESAPAERARMAELLDAWQSAHPPPGRAGAGPSAEDVEKLRALGYVE